MLRAEQAPEALEEDLDRTPVSTPPASEYEERGFARLVPTSRLARLAFSQVVERASHDSDAFAHVNKYMYVAEPTDDDAISELSDAADSQGQLRAPSQQPLWGGYYILDLRVPPKAPGLGWVLGCITVDGKTEGVDLLLSSRHGQHRIGSRHCRLTLQRDTGCLLVASGGRTVSITGSFGTTRLRNGVRALTEDVGLAIGDLQYDLEYHNQSQNPEIYRADLEHYMRNELGNPSFELSHSLSSIGATTDTQLKDYTIKETFASGTSAMVSGAIVKATGQYVAVKKMRRSTRDDPTIECEIETLEALHRNENHKRICHIREIIQNGPIEETYIIYEPFLYAELFKVLRSPTLTSASRVEICHQLVEALTWIHSQGVMHRDLKPQNMGLKATSPPEAVIFDFGHATFDVVSMDHYKGTIWYLAPEVLNIKYRRSNTPYDRAVDVWAMGLSLYELICPNNKWRGQKSMLDSRGRITDYSIHRMKDVNNELESCMLESTAGVIQSMLEVDMKRRIFAADALKEFEAHENEGFQSLPKRVKRSDGF